ncbi:MAG: DNA repair protein RadA [Candidatus Omnitrophica bacterium]|nr:DNA repair protein RadA [Candidatus Omnitrophota bacterium]
MSCIASSCCSSRICNGIPGSCSSDRKGRNQQSAVSSEPNKLLAQHGLLRVTKPKAVFICQQCGCQAVKWAGRCPSCEAWNTMVEEIVEEPSRPSTVTAEGASPTSLASVVLDEAARISTGIGELDRVLGGGLVPGSVTLVGGEPGIGKSTLLLSMAGRLSATGCGVLYISGEESLRQTKLRATRLGLGSSPISLLAQTQLEAIEEAIRHTTPQVVIIDSIQVVESGELSSAPGSISQVRACAHALVSLAKTSGCAVLLVGHVTKEGFLAGPKVLEHVVDTVLHFEGEPTSGFRLLRSTKNRFGATYELGVFHMTAEGLVEVSNPSELFLSDRSESAPGCMVTVTLEGSRPLLVELQALTSPCTVGFPRRRTTGVEFQRLTMLLAVLERRAGLGQLAQQDVFVSSLGGVRVVEPAADLAIAVAVASSLKERVTTRTTVAIGEVGLTGEIRPVVNLAQRLHEAKRVGFQRCVVAATPHPLQIEGLQMIGVRHVREALDAALASSIGMVKG